MSSERILTVPAEEEPGEQYLVTGNEYVALPELRASDGACMSLNVLHRAVRGLIEWTGEDPAGHPHGQPFSSTRGTSGKGLPLFQPVLVVDGRRVELASALRSGLEQEWLPEWYGNLGDLALRLAWYAPPGYRGCVLAWGLRNTGTQAYAVEAGLSAHFGVAYATVFHRRALEGVRTVRPYPWTKSMVAEAVPGLPALAVALKAHPEPAVAVCTPQRAENATASPLSLQVAQRAVLGPGEERWLPFYISVGTEADGAATAGVDLARRGHAALRRETRERLQAMSRRFELPGLHRCYHRNLFFNLYFARGLTLDSEEEVLVTSRSPRYYVSAAHWNRDSLLWSLPGLLLADPAVARGALLAAFRLYARNAGIHACYIDGSVLYPGFELDELAAFPIALGRYLAATGDWSLAAEPAVVQGLATWEAKLWPHKHPGRMLFRTFLLPSDDPAQLPYVTYDNALTALALDQLAAIRRHAGEAAAAERLAAAAAQLRADLRTHAVVAGPLGPMFAWAFEPGGEHVLYDEPSGSLALLAHYGCVAPDDPVFRNTVAWIHSPHNPHWLSEGRYAGPACPHAPRSAWVLSMASDLLAGIDRERLLRLVAEVPMDNGYACESVDPESGALKTGAAFATCAGFLAAAVLAAAEATGAAPPAPPTGGP